MTPARVRSLPSPNRTLSRSHRPLLRWPSTPPLGTTGVGKSRPTLSAAGVVEVLLADRPVAVGRVTLTNDVAGTIDFAACSSVQPPSGRYVMRLASGAEHGVSIQWTGVRR